MANSKAPKVTVKWTEKKQDTYNVDGDYKKVFEFFQQRNAQKKEWGSFKPTKPAVAFKPKKGPITDVILKIGHTTTMPKWTGYSKAPKDCQAAWDRMYKSLEKHEEGHRLILLEQVAKFSQDVSTTEGLDKSKLNTFVKQLSPNIDKAQKEMDTKTQHGRLQGVFLPAPGDCDGLVTSIQLTRRGALAGTLRLQLDAGSKGLASGSWTLLSCKPSDLGSRLLGDKTTKGSFKSSGSDVTVAGSQHAFVSLLKLIDKDGGPGKAGKGTVKAKGTKAGDDEFQGQWTLETVQAKGVAKP